MTDLVLSINSGSSSLKLGWFQKRGGDEHAVLTATADAIGKPEGELQLKDAAGNTVFQIQHVLESQPEALARLVEAAAQHVPQPPAALGHRVVHGGPSLTEHTRLTPEVEDQLRTAEHFAPLHIPAALMLIDQARKQFPDVPAIACFDTAFHRTMPEVAQRYPLPATYFEQGLRRYGFHGLSYESIVHRLGAQVPHRLIMAHLGNGSSLCAARDGVSIDTTMGLTPTGGIPMATRSGDLDPGVVLFLARQGQLDPDALEDLLNHHAGLAGLSGGEPDMRLLTAAMATDPRARLAVEAYATAARKAIGAYTALLGGLDLLVFTGGIGEHSPEVRNGILSGLDFLGLTAASSRVQILATEEERQIARICRRMLAA